jgi:hypothetical protein
LWFGTGIHYALEQHYNPSLQRDPIESFLTWYGVVYNGGTIPGQMLELSYDPKPELLIDHSGGEKIYKVKGLNVLLPSEDHSEIEEHRELGVKMLGFYKKYAERNDDFKALETEHSFSVPIWDFSADRIMKAIDTREDSPNYGKELEVHYRGKIDAPIYWENQDKYGVIDHKTTSRIDDDYFASLELDEQVTSYLWASEVEAKYYGLPWAGKQFDTAIYQALRKTYPKLPTMLRNGMFSIDRSKESVTWGTLKRVIELGDLQPIIDLDPKYQAYVEYVKNVGDEQFIIRKIVRRNRQQLISAGKRIWMEARDMLSEPLIYPSPTGDYYCLHCPFRVPCIATEDGINVAPMLNNDYISNKSR